MSYMVNCPLHDDRVASMKIYGDIAWCFVCHMSIPTTELNIIESPRLKQEPTNVPERIKHIKALPKKYIRGFDLHCEEDGSFYIVWPGENYYKKRTNNPKTRYIGPAGVKAPLLAFPGRSNHLIVVEGELNAMSLYEAIYGDYTVVSPGSAGEFMRHIALYKAYNKVTLILDNDAAGLVHGYQVKEVLLKSRVNTTIVLMNKDFNQILQDGGEDAVRAKFEEAIK